jgi:PIN domain nuclease of toxin-antitoxin system
MRFRTSPNDPAEILNRLPIVVVPFDRDQAHGAGTRISLTLPAGLSLGDRTCLALARIRGWPALTADHAWLGIAMAAGVEVTMIR